MPGSVDIGKDMFEGAEMFQGGICAEPCEFTNGVGKVGVGSQHQVH